jgi:glycosyltransferase involved in cell wall biosynthesis
MQNTEMELSLYKPLGLKIVRYSPKESKIPSYAGSDAVIRFYKDEDEFSGWTPQSSGVMTLGQNMEKRVISIGQSVKKRKDFCGFRIFEEATKGFDRFLYGPDNEDSGIPGGLLSYSDMKKALRESRVYFYTGTYPAPYTLNFIEALMTGIPIVAIGPSMANVAAFPNNEYTAGYVPGQSTYEVHEIIKNGVNGFVSDDIAYLRTCITKLLENDRLAEFIGSEGRKTAIELFGKKVIKQQWKEFLEHL